METETALGFEDLFGIAVSDMAKAISERNGESQAQQFARCQAAVHMIMGFQPRYAIEVLLAGHCVMVHEVLVAEVHDSLYGESATNRRSVVTLNKAFNDNLDRLGRYRERVAEGRRDAAEPPPVADAPAMPAAIPLAGKLNRAARRQAARAEMHAVATASRVASRQTSPRPDGTIFHQPTGEATCRTTPEAMTALAAGDPAGFARALGIDTPSEAFLAAARTPGSPFDPQATGPWPADVVASARKG